MEAVNVDSEPDLPSSSSMQQVQISTRSPGFWVSMGPEKTSVRVFRNRSELVLSLLDCCKVLCMDKSSLTTFLNLVQKQASCVSGPFSGCVLHEPHIYGQGGKLYMATARIALGLFQLYWSKSMGKTRAKLTGMEPFLDELKTHIAVVSVHI